MGQGEFAQNTSGGWEWYWSQVLRHQLPWGAEQGTGKLWKNVQITLTQVAKGPSAACHFQSITSTSIVLRPRGLSIVFILPQECQPRRLITAEPPGPRTVPDTQQAYNESLWNEGLGREGLGWRPRRTYLAVPPPPQSPGLASI